MGTQKHGRAFGKAVEVGMVDGAQSFPPQSLDFVGIMDDVTEAAKAFAVLAQLPEMLLGFADCRDNSEAETGFGSISILYMLWT